MPIQYIDIGGTLFDYQWLKYDAGFSCWGHPQRNFTMPRATGRYIVSLDDDDMWAGDALANIQEAIRSDVEPRLHIFRMQYNDGRVLWQRPVVMFGNVGTPMMVFPNNPNVYGAWGRAYEGDYFFLETTVANLGIDHVAWHEQVIALIEPTGVLA